MTTTEPAPPPTTTEIGRSRARKEDARLITGRSRYTDAITPAGTLFVHVVRSPVAHATITGINIGPAIADGATLVHPELGTNKNATQILNNPQGEAL